MKIISKLMATSFALAALAPILAAGADSTRAAPIPSSTDEARAAAGQRYAQGNTRSDQAIGRKPPQIARVPTTTDEARGLGAAPSARGSEVASGRDGFERRGIPKGTDEARAMAGEEVPALKLAK